MGREFMNRIAESAFAERAEKRQILADLRGRGATEMRQFITGRRVLATGVEILEVAEVHRQASDGRVGYSLHGGGLVKFFTKLGSISVIY